LNACEVNVVHPLVKPDTAISCQVKVRYNQQPQPAEMRIHHGKMHVLFANAISAITPGQAAVAYLDDQLLCGGWIQEVK